MEQLFSFFFKYRPFFFRKGEFVFQWGLPFWQVGLSIATLAVFLYLLYHRQWFRSDRPMGWLLVLLRGVFFLILLVLIMRPSLVLSTLVPRENILSILVDNSRSMGIRDTGEPRGQAARRLLSEDSDFVSDLEEKFYLRFFRFDSHSKRIEAPFQLDWQGNQTNLTAGLERILSENKNLPLGGIVLFSDGSDNSYRDFTEVLSELKVRNIPVHAVGLGPEAPTRDIEITQVSAPRSLLPDTVAIVRVTLRRWGFTGSRGLLEVREGNSLLQTKEVYFPRDSKTLVEELKLTPKSEGIKTYHFRLLPLEGEQIRENNQRTTVIQVRNSKPRILYVEGHPRWEYKFIRQAMAEDENLRLETLLRTALNKFYRQGIAEETILAAGFPSTRKELFDYKALIFGSVESSFFTYPQMEMVRDFVGKRGGGFLMLGGHSSFGAGLYQNTPIEEILPVWLDSTGQDDHTSTSRYVQTRGQFRLTQHGNRHPALQLLPAEEGNDSQKWSEMPELTDWNRVGSTKSGAILLAHLRADEAHHDVPLLVFQRYGRGQTLALLTGSSWRWQMLQDHQDQSHETFWRQMLRWLVRSAKDPVMVETEREIYGENEVVRIRAEVNDRSFNRINDARVEALITSPSGVLSKLPLQWSAHEDGVYQEEWIPQEEGLYQVQVLTERKTTGQESYGQAATHFLISSRTREYFDAFQKPEFLQKLARETGGNYYTLSNVQRIPEEIVYTKKRSSVIEVLDLWDMPINLLLLVSLLVSEWILRKSRGSI